MENLVNNFILGITSGIVTVLIVFFAKSIWIKNLIPWFERLVYKDIYISGKWKSNIGNDEYDGELVEIYQSAHKVNGYIRVSSEEDYTETYRFEGIFKNSILTGTFTVYDKSNFDSGSMTMMLKENGNKLIGYTAFYDQDEEKLYQKNILGKELFNKYFFSFPLSKWECSLTQYATTQESWSENVPQHLGGFGAKIVRL